jgi:ABC-type Fe3+/spermidine/putrescine transport system ATPase subunit
MLALHEISLAYEGRPLLDRVSLQLGDGEILALLGTSGSGKTSLLRIIAGLEKPDSGTVSWDGVQVDQVPTEKRNFGLVFQDYALFPHLSVADNIGFGLQMQGMELSERKAQIRSILDLIGLPGWERKRVDVLSGGEQQRVALGRALAVRPRLLLLDEPLNALDKVMRVELAFEIRRMIADAHIPAIYVTHDQEEAFTIATRVAILHDGIILQAGNPLDLISHPSHEWIANFLGLGTVLDGTIFKKRATWAATKLGKIDLEKTSFPIQDGDCVKILVRPEDCAMRFSAPRGIGWFEGLVTRVQMVGQSVRIRIQFSNGVDILCKGTGKVELGNRVWWKNEKASVIRVVSSAKR